MRFKTLILLSLLATTLSYAEKDKRRSITVLAGFPHPTNIGLDYRAANKKFSIGITGGYTALSMNYSTYGKYNIATKNAEARLRLHPFGSSFFIGVAGGYQVVTANTSRTLSVSGLSIAATGYAEIKNFYTIPHLGWFKVAGNGFTIGFEVGVYVPFATATKVDLTSANPLFSVATTSTEYQTLKSDSQKFCDQAGKQALPFLTLLRLGWSF